jgi:hypothetical protein
MIVCSTLRMAMIGVSVDEQTQRAVGAEQGSGAVQ